MKLNYRYLFVPIVSVAIMIACTKNPDDSDTASKDNPPKTDTSSVPPPPSVITETYVATNDIIELSAEMYTKDGRVTDLDKVKDFVNSKNITTKFNVGEPKTINLPMELKLLINNNLDVELKSKNAFVSLGKVIKETNNLLIFKANDSVSFQKESSSPGELEELDSYGYNFEFYICRTFIDKINLPLVNRTINCKSNVGGTNPGSTCKHKISFPIEIESENTVYIPMLSSYKKTLPLGPQPKIVAITCPEVLSDGWNLPNPDFYKNLGAGDTIIIQKKRIVLKKAP